MKKLIKINLLIIFTFGYLNLFSQCNHFVKFSTAKTGRTTIAIKDDGTLWGWGINSSYELGINNTTNINSPIQIGIDNDWLEISSGIYHTIALKKNGTLWAWGNNSQGQLGNSTYTTLSIPTQIGNNNNWLKVGTSTYSSYAIKNDGTLWTWGGNDYGQLGLGNTTATNIPTKVGIDNKWQKVEGGYFHALAIKDDGSLWGWGYNAFGNLGNGNTTSQSSPIQIGFDYNWQSISSFYYSSYAIKMDGSLWSTGYNSNGQLGIGSTTNSSTFLQIGSAFNWIKLVTGAEHVLAINNNFELYTWGINNDYQLIDGTNINKTTPQLITTGYKISDVAATANSSLINTSNNEIFTIGNNIFGQLGNGNNTNQISLQNISMPTFSSIVTTTSLSTKAQGSYNTYSMGCNPILSIQQRGLHPISGSTTSKVWVDAVQNPLFVKRHYEINPHHNFSQYSGWVTLYFTQQDFDDFNLLNSTDLPTNSTDAIGKSNLLIEKRFGTSINGSGNLDSYGGINTIDPNDNNIIWNPILSRWEVSFYSDGFGGYWIKTFILGLTNTCESFAALNTKLYHTNTIFNNGTLWGWGYNVYGQIGDGTSSNRDYPIQIGNRNTWKDIATGSIHSLGITNDSTLWCWGSNAYGQFGLGYTTPNSSIPKPLNYTDKWIAIGSTNYSIYAIKANGTLWAAGYNGYGELGIGNTTSQYQFTQVGTATNWSKVKGGLYHVIAQKADGSLWAWGDNVVGQLALGDNTSRNTPQQIGIDYDWKDFYVGQYFTVAIKNDGTLWAAGYNNVGQLGIGNNTNQNSFVQIGTNNDWISISTGINFCFAANRSGAIFSWGDNAYGQLGDNTTINKNAPNQLTNINKHIDIFSLGENYTNLVSEYGELISVGLNNYGQLANNSFLNSNSFTQSISGPNFSSLPTTQTETIKHQLFNTIYEKNCSEIAKVTQYGLTPISGLTSAKIYIDPSQPSIPGSIYVKRHFEITPQFNASSATGKVTIYVTQQDFDDFNAVSSIDLPTGPLDISGKANLLIEKRSGISNDGSGALLSYGAPSNILVDDDNIVWNPTLSRWEITFFTNGFSGFWIKTITGYLASDNSIQLVVNIQNNQHLLTWHTKENEIDKYFIEQSFDGYNFDKIGEKLSLGNGNQIYTFNTSDKKKIFTYYRIKQISSNGQAYYSNIVKIRNNKSLILSAFPNPTKQNLNITFARINNSKLLILNPLGEIVYKTQVSQLNVTINVEKIAAGIYYIKYNNEIIKFVKQ
jgi:alpha-tubulin suppressor-like RCC1 family protein